MKAGRLRIWLITTAAALIVLAATLSALFRAAVVAVPGYRAELEDWVGRTLDHPARIGSMNLLWHGFEPVLELRDVELLTAPGGPPIVRAAQFRLGFGLRHLLRGRPQPSDLTLTGLQLGLQVDADGQLHITGAGTGGGTTDYHAALAGIGHFDEILLDNCRLTLDDPQLDPQPLVLGIARADLRVGSGRMHLSAAFQPPATVAQGLNVDALVQGPIDTPQKWRVDWNATATGLAADVPWIARYLAEGAHIELSGARLVAQGEWAGGRWGAQQLEFSAASIAALHDHAAFARVGGVRLVLRAQPEDEDWKIGIEPHLADGARGAWPEGHWKLRVQPPADGNDSGIDFEANFLRLDDVVPWLALWRQEPRVLRSLHDLHGDLHDIVFDRLRPDPLDMDVPGQAQPQPSCEYSARFDHLSLPVSADAPGVAGLAGRVKGDADSGHVALDESPVTLDMPAVFEQTVAIDGLSGGLDWRRESEGWRLTAPEFGFRLAGTVGSGRVDLLLPHDKSRSPDIDLHVDFASEDATMLKPLLPKT